MKRLKLIIGFTFLTSVCFAQSADSLRLATLEQKVVELEATLANQGVKQNQANATIGNLQKEVKQIKTTIKNCPQGGYIYEKDRQRSAVFTHG